MPNCLHELGRSDKIVSWQMRDAISALQLPPAKPQTGHRASEGRATGSIGIDRLSASAPSELDRRHIRSMPKMLAGNPASPLEISAPTQSILESR